MTTKDIFVDEKLVQICKSIAHPPKFQNQLMQIVLQLDPDVLIEAQKIKFQHVILLEFPSLRQLFKFEIFFFVSRTIQWFFHQILVRFLLLPF